MCNRDDCSHKVSVLCVSAMLLVFVLLVGCASRVPQNSNDCAVAPYKQMWEERGKTVDDCKMAAVKAEDYRFKRAQEEAMEKYMSAQCWALHRAAYDKRIKRCVIIDLDRGLNDAL